MDHMKNIKYKGGYLLRWWSPDAIWKGTTDRDTYYK